MSRELIEAGGWHDLPISVVTDRIGLTRSAFYKHFADKQELLLAHFDVMRDELDTAADPWRERRDDPRESLRAALAQLVSTFVEHGRLLRAMADEARLDPGIASMYAEFDGGLRATVAALIEAEISAGRSTLTDPSEVGSALVWMNERYLLDRFGQHPLGDAQRTADTLAEVWTRTIYGS